MLAQFAVVDVRSGAPAATFVELSTDSPLHVPSCPADTKTGVVPWHLYAVAPVLPGGLALLGETSK